MSPGVLAHGDGIFMHVVSGFSLDQPNFEQHVFVPYAVDDPDNGSVYEHRITPPTPRAKSMSELLPERWMAIPESSYRHAEATCSPDAFGRNFRRRIGNGETLAVAFIRKEQRARMLFCLTEGIERNDGAYIALRVVGRGAPVTEIWNLASLLWRVASSELEQDFPAYLAIRYGLRRRLAWLFAWVLVHNAYAERAACNIGLIRLADALSETGGSGTKADVRQRAHASFERRLWSEVGLYRRSK